MNPAPCEHWAGIEALFVDFDGVIIDSGYAHYQAWRDVFHGHGLWLCTDAWADHWAIRDHNSKPPVTAMMERRLGAPLEVADGLIREVRQHYRALVASLPARRGIEGWLREAAAHDVRCAVVTDGPEPIPAAWGAVIEQYNGIAFTADIARGLHQVRTGAS